MTNATTEDLYRESQQAICALITHANQHTPVPACPGWTVRDVLAHLTGALQDIHSGNTAGGPTPEWTAAQVDRLRDTDIDELAVMWAEAADKAGPIFERYGKNILPDVVTHEFDVRGALGNRERRDAEALLAVYHTVHHWKQAYFVKHALPALAVIADGHRIVLGEGEPKATLITTLYEASRVFTGRRSLNQVRKLEWSSNPAPWLEHLSALGQAEQDVIE